MSSVNYKSALEQLKGDLREAKIRHRDLLQRTEDEEQAIMHLRQTVASLSKLCGETFEDEDEFGLTDLIRMAVKTAGGAPLTALDVKARLEQLGYPQKSDSALPSIHTVLKRLALKGEVDDVVIKDGKTAYRWIKKEVLTPGEAKRMMQEHIPKK